jgi:hypothetical protein
VDQTGFEIDGGAFQADPADRLAEKAQRLRAGEPTQDSMTWAPKILVGK